jgi:predicted acyl esterase
MSEGRDSSWSESKDGMRIEWDVPINMDDGVALRCDVFRPDDGGRHPVLLAAGPYGKWLSFQARSGAVNGGCCASTSPIY